MVGEEINNVKGVFDNTDGHEFLTVVAAVHHEGVGQSFYDGALGFAESFRGIAACCVGEVHGRADLDVVAAQQS